MGDVFVAQDLKLNRLVAIKVVRLAEGPLSIDAVPRFHREIEVLTALEHPNIARILDAGALADKRPYYVMEFINGEPVHRFADRLHLSIRQRLSLFLQICDGVFHAHRCGILHRDLKPGNILAYESKGTYFVKVIDFGLAKIMHGQKRDALVTIDGLAMGTPAYMSPEQAAVSGVLDVRTDVYSLGIILFELLAGTRPFEGKQEDVLKQMRDSDPPTMEERLLKLGERASTVASQRSANVRQLAKLLSGDIQLVIRKAIRKDRNDRYPDVRELSQDVKRWLENKPVSAARGRWIYPTRKFVRNHWSAVFAAAILGVCVTLGGALVLFRSAQSVAEREIAKKHQDELGRLQTERAGTQQALQEAERERLAIAAQAKASRQLVDKLVAEVTTYRMQVEHLIPYATLNRTDLSSLLPSLGMTEPDRSPRTLPTQAIANEVLHGKFSAELKHSIRNLVAATALRSRLNDSSAADTSSQVVSLARMLNDDGSSTVVVDALSSAPVTIRSHPEVSYELELARVLSGQVPLSKAALRLPGETGWRPLPASASIPALEDSATQPTSAKLKLAWAVIRYWRTEHLNANALAEALAGLKDTEASDASLALLRTAIVLGLAQQADYARVTDFIGRVCQPGSLEQNLLLVAALAYEAPQPKTNEQAMQAGAAHAMVLRHRWQQPLAEDIGQRQLVLQLDTYSDASAEVSTRTAIETVQLALRLRVDPASLAAPQRSALANACRTAIEDTLATDPEAAHQVVPLLARCRAVEQDLKTRSRS